MSKRILAIALQLCSSIAFADGLVEYAEKSYSDAAKASEAISEAASQIELAAQTLGNGKRTLDEVLAKVNSLKYGNLILAEKISSNSEKISQSLKDYKTFLSEYKNLDEYAAKLSSALPLGEERIEYGRALIKSAKALVEKNPGDNYQDLKYVNSIAEQYNNKVDALNRLQKEEFSAVSINLKMCGPHLEGIKTFLDMAEDFNSKARSICESNAKSADEITREYSKLSDGLSDYYNQYLEAHGKLSAEAADISDAFLNLAIFVLNELPKSPEYKDSVFKNAEYIRISIPQARSIVASVKYKNSQPSGNFADAAKASLPEGMFQRGMVESAGLVPGTSTATNIQPKGLRKEILETSAKITALSKEIANAELLLRQRIEKISELTGNIKSLHTNMSATLNASINDFATAQTSAAETEMVSGMAKISAMQFEVIESQIKKSFENAKNKTNQAAAFAKSMTKNLESAKSAIK